MVYENYKKSHLLGLNDYCLGFGLFPSALVEVFISLLL